MLGDGFEDLREGYGDDTVAHDHESSTIGALVSDMMRGVNAASGRADEFVVEEMEIDEGASDMEEHLDDESEEEDEDEEDEDEEEDSDEEEQEDVEEEEGTEDY